MRNTACMKRHDANSRRLFDLAQNLRSGSAMGSKRSQSVVKAHYKIHERSSSATTARAA